MHDIHFLSFILTNSTIQHSFSFEFYIFEDLISLQTDKFRVQGNTETITNRINVDCIKDKFHQKNKSKCDNNNLFLYI